MGLKDIRTALKRSGAGKENHLGKIEEKILRGSGISPPSMYSRG